ncbi:MAG: hypothetical protein H6739_21700 [Alphaproteobacteria bacterium]|nr:hypothetical protein [Alphaproteobacteria bacterium]
MDRRARFRAYMKDLDPTGDPLEAVEKGFYVPAPTGVGARIATRLELQPDSSHLLVGGVGSGKTTELIRIRKALEEVEDIAVVRVDVPSVHRADKLRPGVLLALAALEALRLVEDLELDGGQAKVRKRARQVIRRHARGAWVDGHYEYDPHDDDDPGEWVAGVLEEPETDGRVSELAEALSSLSPLSPKRQVMLFDGLDRVVDLARFSEMLRQDLPALKDVGVGAVVVGPQTLRFSASASVLSWFTQVHLHGAADWESEAGRAFLKSVLRQRVAAELLPDDAIDAVMASSGGLLRDVIAAARMAGEEAYADGSDTVGVEHVAVAAERLGRSLLLGISQRDVKRLRELAPTERRVRRAGALKRSYPPFTPATDDDIALLMQRLVIEIPTAPPSYRLHPAVLPLLPGLRRSA